MTETSCRRPELDYPLDYTFKVIVDPERVQETQLLQIVTSLLDSSNRLRSVTQRPSKKGSYLSYSITAHIKARSELETVYTAFRKLDGVVYLL